MDKKLYLQKDETKDVGNMNNLNASNFLKKQLQVKHEHSITTTNMIRPTDY